MCAFFIVIASTGINPSSNGSSGTCRLQYEAAVCCWCCVCRLVLLVVDIFNLPIEWFQLIMLSAAVNTQSGQFSLLILIDFAIHFFFQKWSSSDTFDATIGTKAKIFVGRNTKYSPLLCTHNISSLFFEQFKFWIINAQNNMWFWLNFRWKFSLDLLGKDGLW